MIEAEFTGLFTEHYWAVLGYGLRRVDPATAHDIAAETFLVAWRQLDVAPDHPRPWLLAVARRVLANELRRQSRHDRLTDRIGLHAGHGLVHPDHAVSLAEAGHVAAAMATLTARDQEVLQLFGWEQLDQREAAQVLGCTVPAVKVRLHRARRRLRGALRTTSGPEPPPGPAGAAPRRAGRTTAMENL